MSAAPELTKGRKLILKTVYTLAFLQLLVLLIFFAIDSYGYTGGEQTMTQKLHGPLIILNVLAYVLLFAQSIQQKMLPTYVLVCLMAPSIGLLLAIAMIVVVFSLVPAGSESISSVVDPTLFANLVIGTISTGMVVGILAAGAVIAITSSWQLKQPK